MFINRRNYICDALLYLALLAFVSSCTTLKDIHVASRDNGGRIKIKPGQVLVATLESNPSTGYQWEVVAVDTAALQQIGEAEFLPAVSTGKQIVGAGGMERFRFKALKKAESSLKLVYRRPWEKGEEPAKIFLIQIIVR
jgi:inhibitor of cysteine peptidase